MADPYGGYRFSDFYPIENAPWLTAQSDYMTDTNVNKLLGKAMPNPNQFSVDALGMVPPEVRALFADAVAGAGGDAYGAYSAMNTDEYQTALIERLAGNIGSTIPQGYVVNVHGQLVPGNNADKVMYDRSGGDEAKAAAEQGYAKQYGNSLLEDAFFSAAPSSQRNTQMIDNLYERFGGMPFPGQFDGGGAMGGGSMAVGPTPDSPVRGQIDPYTEELLHMAVQAGAIPPPPKRTGTPRPKTQSATTRPYRESARSTVSGAGPRHAADQRGRQGSKRTDNKYSSTGVSESSRRRAEIQRRG